LDAWDAAGVTCVSATQGDFGTPPFSYESGLDALAHTAHLLDELPDHLVKATRAADIRRAKQEHKHAFVLNFQNTTHFGLDCRAGAATLTSSVALGADQTRTSTTAHLRPGSGVFSRAPTWTAAGTGTLVPSGRKTFPGDTTISSGTVVATSGASLENTTGGVR